MDERVEGTSNRDSQYPNREKYPRKKKKKDLSDQDKNSLLGHDEFKQSQAKDTSSTISYGNNPKLKSTILKKINAPKDDISGR